MKEVELNNQEISSSFPMKADVNSRPYFTRPTWSKTLFFLKHLVPLFALFFLVYGGSNWVSSLRQETYKLYFDWETKLPFVPWMILFYFSVFVSPVIALFVLSQEEMRKAALSITGLIFMSGLFFILIPTQNGFAWPPTYNEYHLLFDVVFTLDRPHNLFPSLHISFSLLFMLILSQRAGTVAKALWGIWFFLVSCSVVLVHQHHVLDIVGGIIVGLIGYKKIYLNQVTPWGLLKKSKSS